VGNRLAVIRRSSLRLGGSLRSQPGWTPKFHRWLIAAQDFRNVGDYGVEAHVSREQAELVCDWSEEFIRAAEALLAEK
jgi:hypothetical protein